MSKTQRKSKLVSEVCEMYDTNFLFLNLLFSLQSNAIVENFPEQNFFGAHVSERELKGCGKPTDFTKNHQLQPFFGKKKSKPVYNVFWQYLV